MVGLQIAFKYGFLSEEEMNMFLSVDVETSSKWQAAFTLISGWGDPKPVVIAQASLARRDHISHPPPLYLSSRALNRKRREETRTGNGKWGGGR